MAKIISVLSEAALMRTVNVGVGVEKGDAVLVGAALRAIAQEDADDAGLALSFLGNFPAVEVDIDNIKTYTSGVAATFAAVAQGDYVYISVAGDLTLSPQDENGDSNVIFGIVIDGDLSGTATEYTEPNVEIAYL